MKGRVVVLVILIILIIGIGLAVTAWVSEPKLISLTPGDGESNVPVTAKLRILFSRPMEGETVTERLIFEPHVDGSYQWEKTSLTFTPDPSWPSGVEMHVTLGAGARAESWLALPMDGTRWSFTTGGENLAYLWPSDGPADIYALNPATGNITQYTKGMEVFEYSTSADGMLIYFSAGNSQNGADLYLFDRSKFTNSPQGFYKPELFLLCGAAQCRTPVVSYSGQYLAYEHLIPTSNGFLGPAIISLLSLPEMEPVPLGIAEHESVQPSWSPTGQLLFFDRTSHGYEVVNLQTLEKIHLSNQTGQPGEWSPDGGYFLAPEIFYYQSGEYAETGTSHLIRYNTTTGEYSNLSKGDDVEDVEGTYSPDGGMIAFVRKYLHEGSWEFGRQLWIMDADGSDPHPITDEENYNHYDLAWSRDGRILAFVRFNEADVSKPTELWMVNSDGTNPIQLVIGGYSPRWIP